LSLAQTDAAEEPTLGERTMAFGSQVLFGLVLGVAVGRGYSFVKNKRKRRQAE